jgi:hypothetical protein
MRGLGSQPASMASRSATSTNARKVAHVADGGEPGQQRVPGVAGAGQRLLGPGPGQQFRVSATPVRLADQVGMTVDEAGQHGMARQVHGRGALSRGVGGRDDVGKAVAVDDHGAAGQQFPGHHIKQQAGADNGARGRSHPAV